MHPNERRGRTTYLHPRALNIRNERRARSRHHVGLIQDLVRSEPVGVPALDRAGRAVIFQHLAVAGVGDENGRGAVHRPGLAAALRVVGIAGGIARAHRRGQPVLGVVAEREGAVIGEIAVAIVARRHRADHRVLVERIGGVDRTRRRGGIVEPGRVRHGLTVALVGFVIGMLALGSARDQAFYLL